MGGVGGFIRENRTLYVGRIAISQDTENVIRRQFGQFGPLERVRILKNRGVAFVTYKTRANAEFAREAMMNQNLENNEIINVRWATADPKAIANRLDAQDDQAEQERVDRILAQTQGGQDERQESESELPAEFTSVKRDIDEDGFDQASVKRVKADQEEEAKEEAKEEATTYEYTQEDYNNYYYQQQAYYEQQQQEAEEAEKADSGGIIPQNILANLKSLANNKSPIITSNKTSTAPAAADKKPAAAGGLGSLADYGSESEDDE
jgi:RNA recognition motif-containing protein